MKRFSSCCRKPNVDPEQPESEPEPEPAPAQEPEPEPEPPSTSRKTDASETALECRECTALEPKRHCHFTEFSILCMESKKPDPADSSSDIISSSIRITSDKKHAETIINIMERAKRGEKSFLDNSEQKICFLRAISASCEAAQESGQGTLNLPYSKDELAEVIVLVAKTLPIHAVPPKILS